MFRILISLVFLAFSLPLFAQTGLSKIQQKIEPVSSDSTRENYLKQENIFWKTFHKIKDIESEQNGIQGNVKFGFVGNSTATKEIYILNSSIDVKQGIYPGEFEFSTLLNTQFNSGQLEENLSNLRITYDRFLSTEKNEMRYEGFVFVNRRSDKYLGVDQRYEIGCGITIAHWSRNLAEKYQQKIDEIKESDITIIPSTGEVAFKADGKRDTIQVKNITKEDASDFESAIKNIEHTIVKRYTPFRAGILLGVFYEIENVVLENIEIPGDDTKKEQHEFETSSKYRWEFRPTLDFFIKDRIRVKIRPFFKMPMPWESSVKVKNKSKLDYRIDFPTIFALKLDENFELSAEYRYCYDNTPNSFLDPYVSGEWLAVNDTHHFVSFQVVYKF